jgi:hypothetical protein
MGLTMKEWAQAEEGAKQRAIKQIHLALQASANQDWEQADDYYKRAKVELNGYPEEKRSSVFHEAFANNKALTDRVWWDYYIRKTPDDKKDTMMDAFQRLQELQKEKSK